MKTNDQKSAAKETIYCGRFVAVLFLYQQRWLPVWLSTHLHARIFETTVIGCKSLPFHTFAWFETEICELETKILDDTDHAALREREIRSVRLHVVNKHRCQQHCESHTIFDFRQPLHRIAIWNSPGYYLLQQYPGRREHLKVLGKSKPQCQG